ncbi:MAG: DNA helicase [Pseudomonadota bacterium]
MRLSAPIFRLKREARLLARDTAIPLHAALDRIAAREGYARWSHLAARLSAREPAEKLLDMLKPGAMVLIAARPNQGKTMLGLGLVAEAARAGRFTAVFTLDWTEEQVLAGLAEAGAPSPSPRLLIDTSDAIAASHISAGLEGMPRGTVAMIDYLQLLDQARTTPPLADQIAALKGFAERSGVILVLLSQIDRRFDRRDTVGAPVLPGPGDIRLPNPADLSLFDRMVFLDGGEIQITRPI